jgi:hypothetical protein
VDAIGHEESFCFSVTIFKLECGNVHTALQIYSKSLYCTFKMDKLYGR